RVQMSGGFKDVRDARMLAQLLNARALPVPLRPAQTQVVGATLGQDSVTRSINAGLAGLVAVLLFMLIYYRLPGALADIALLFYAALTFAIFKVMGVVLDLPGITGFILSVGMAVDANILIFERLKEEMKSGKTLHAAIDAGFSRAFTSIFDSNMTTWIVCWVLYNFGTSLIRGFALTLAAAGFKDATPLYATDAKLGKILTVRTPSHDPSQLRKIEDSLKTLGGGMEPLSTDSIGPTIAREVTQNAFISVIIASLLIILYLAMRFAIGGFMNGLKYGVCAVIAQLHDVITVTGIFALMGYLKGWHVDSLFVTAALTVIGFSVHDTIVVYDRIRENLRNRQRGETFEQIMNRSVTQTFDRSLNTSFTVVLVLACLLAFGGTVTALFNWALLIGIIIGTYSSIFVASPLVVIWEH